MVSCVFLVIGVEFEIVIPWQPWCVPNVFSLLVLINRARVVSGVVWQTQWIRALWEMVAVRTCACSLRWSRTTSVPVPPACSCWRTTRPAETVRHLLHIFYTHTHTRLTILHIIQLTFFDNFFFSFLCPMIRRVNMLNSFPPVDVDVQIKLFLLQSAAGILHPSFSFSLSASLLILKC